MNPISASSNDVKFLRCINRMTASGRSKLFAAFSKELLPRIIFYNIHSNTIAGCTRKLTRYCTKAIFISL